MPFLNSCSPDFKILYNHRGQTWFIQSITYLNSSHVHSKYALYGTACRTGMTIDKSCEGMRSSWDLPRYWCVV